LEYPQLGHFMQPSTKASVPEPHSGHLSVFAASGFVASERERTACVPPDGDFVERGFDAA
jgi:hypothetical protein